MNCDCFENLKDSKIKVEENGQKAVFLNPGRQKYQRVRVDGCLIKKEIACDYWVIQLEDKSVLVELKGKDVEHAIKQIEATFSFLQKENKKTSSMAALIVCRKPSRNPSFTSKLQKAKANLLKNHQAPLHVVTGAHEFAIDNLLKVTGPF